MWLCHPNVATYWQKNRPQTSFNSWSISWPASTAATHFSSTQRGQAEAKPVFIGLYYLFQNRPPRAAHPNGPGLDLVTFGLDIKCRRQSNTLVECRDALRTRMGSKRWKSFCYRPSNALRLAFGGRGSAPSLRLNLMAVVHQ
jgi:hypothetical protein